MWVSPEGFQFQIEVSTPEGEGIVVGWGQEKDFEAIPAGEVVVKLEKGWTVSFKPNELEEVNTTLVL